MAKTISWTGYEKPMEPNFKDAMFIDRKWFTDKSTVGELFLQGERFCYTIEDTCRQKKLYGKTAIPSGRYEVIMDWSERHQKVMPHILNVPGFTGIRFDVANTANDVLGCIGVGFRRDVDIIYDSKKAHEALCKEILSRLENGPLFLSIAGGISKKDFEA